MLDLGDWIKRSGKYQAITVAIRSNGKALDLGAWCFISETFLYLSGVIHLKGRCLIGEVIQYFQIKTYIEIRPDHKQIRCVYDLLFLSMSEERTFSWLIRQPMLTSGQNMSFTEYFSPLIAFQIHVLGPSITIVYAVTPSGIAIPKINK